MKYAGIFLVSALLLSIPAFAHASLVNRTSQDVITNGLVGWWTFDGNDTRTGVVKDRSSQGNDGALNNLPTSTSYVSGKFGQAIKFPGVISSYVSLANTGGINQTGALTISTWIRPSAVPTGDGIIFAKGGANGTASSEQYLLKVNTSGKLDFEVSNGTTILSSDADANSIVPAANTWYHLVGIYNGTNNVTLYVNGALLTTQTATINALNGSPSSFAGMGSDNAARPFFGTVDDVRLFSRALSAAEVQRLYNLGGGRLNSTPKNAFTSGLLSYWTMDGKDMPNGVMRDVTGNGNDANPSSIASSTFYSPGKLGQGITCDGINDRIFFNGVTLTSTYTWAFWMKPLPGSKTFEAIITNNGGGAGLFYNGISQKLNNWYSGSNHPNNATLPVGVWSHIIVSSNAGSFTFYLNGVPDGTGTSAIGFTPIDLCDDGANEQFGGTLDDFRVYGRALSATEALELYNEGQGKQNVSPQTALTNGLVGYWTFNGSDMTSGRLRDASGNGNSAYFMNISTSTFFKPGKIGQGVQYDGNDDYASVTPSATINSLPAITACAWVYPTADLGDPGSFVPQIIRKTNDAFNNGWDFYMIGQSPPSTNPLGLGTSYTNDGTNFTYIESRTSAVPLNTWTFVCTVQNGNGMANMTLYANAVPLSVSQSGDAGTRGNDSAIPLRIGTGGISTQYDSIGKVDEVRLYNRALSATEIMKLYNMGR
jgi:hypothetical protein